MCPMVSMVTIFFFFLFTLFSTRFHKLAALNLTMFEYGLLWCTCIVL